MKNGEKIETTQGSGYFYNGRLMSESEYYKKVGKKSGGMVKGCSKCGAEKCMCGGGKMKDGGMANYEDGGGIGQKIKNAWKSIIGKEDKNALPMEKNEPYLGNEQYVGRSNPLLTDKAYIEDTDDQGNTKTTTIAMLPDVERQMRTGIPNEDFVNNSTGNSANSMPAPANTYVDEKGLYRIKSGYNAGQIVERNQDGSLTQYLDDKTYSRSKQAQTANQIAGQNAGQNDGQFSINKFAENLGQIIKNGENSKQKGQSKGQSKINEPVTGKQNKPSLKDMMSAGSTTMYSPEGVAGMKYGKTLDKDKIIRNPLGTVIRTAEEMSMILNDLTAQDKAINQSRYNEQNKIKNQNNDSLQKAMTLYKMGRISKQELDQISNKLKESTDMQSKVNFYRNIGKRS